MNEWMERLRQRKQTADPAESQAADLAANQAAELAENQVAEPEAQPGKTDPADEPAPREALLPALEAEAVEALARSKQPPERVRGHLTGALLGDVRCLLRPFTRDPFFSLRPPLDLQAMRLSLELSEMTYELSVDEWVDAGWTDVSIQVDNTLQSDVTTSVQGEQMRSFVNAWKLRRAKSALKERNPIAQIGGALRQREKSDTIKAVTMLRKAEPGLYVLAIGFMGTGSRFYDWFSNLRFATEDGFHKGFSQLSEYFLQSGDRILFPATAAELGLERLTLNDILAELKSPVSRFRLWMAGHSQGGAVMQIFTHTLIRELGALPQNLIGYGFASPTVAGAGLAGDPAAYPLYHVLNTDDLVPKVGSLQHLGFCLQYQANEPFRAAAYGWEADGAPVREALKPLTLQMTDTLTTMEGVVALLNVLLREKADETLEMLSDQRWSVAPLDKLFTFAGDKAQDWLARVVAYTGESYRMLTGRDMDAARIAALEALATPIVRDHSMMELLRGLYDLTVPPHAIMRDHRKVRGSYAFIVARGYLSLRGSVWVSSPDGLPRKRYADSLRWVLDSDAPQAGTLTAAVRRRKRAEIPALLRQAAPHARRTSARPRPGRRPIGLPHGARTGKR